MQTPNDEQMDRLIGDHFARQNSSPPDFERLWQQAEQAVASRAERPQPGRWMRLAAAAVLLVGIGGVLVTTDVLRMGAPIDGHTTQFAVDEDMQWQVVSTTRWRAPSDRFLDQTQPLPGWQLPGRAALQMEEVL